MRNTIMVDRPEAIISNTSLANKVYDYLEDCIVKTAYRPGKALNETEIANYLNISRSPVREAILRLEQVGLVKKEGKCRVVAHISMEDFHQSYQLWEMIEPFGAALSCETATGENIRSLGEKLSEMTENAEKGRLVEYRQGNYDFHALLLASCDNPMIVNYHKNVLNRIRWCSNYSIDSDEIAHNSDVSHEQILNAYSQKDKALVEQLTREHIRSAYLRIREKLSVSF